MRKFAVTSRDHKLSVTAGERKGEREREREREWERERERESRLALVQNTSGRGNPMTWQSSVAGSPTLAVMS